METNKSFSSRLISYLNIILRIVVIVLVFILLRAIYKGLKQEGYIVEAIHVPKQFSDSGYNGVVIAKQIQDNLQKLRKSSQRTTSDSTIVLATNNNNLNIDVMGIGVSSTSLTHHLKDFLGIKTKSIGGDLTLLEKDLNFSLRITDYPVKHITVSSDTLTIEEAYNELIDQVSESILSELDPYYLAIKHIKEKNEVEAKKVLRDMIANKPKEAKWAYAAWGAMKFEKDDFEGAIGYLNKALDLDPDFAMPKNTLAWIHFFSKDYPKAITLLEEVLETDYNRFGVLNGLATSHRLLGETDKAETYLKRLVAENEENVYAYGNYSNFLMNHKKDTLAAIELFKSAGDKIPISDDYFVTRAMHFFMQEKPDSASVFLTKALDYNPNNLGALQAMSGYQSNYKKDHEAAAVYLKRHVEVMKKTFRDPVSLSNVYNGLAVNAYERKNLEEATEYINKAIELFPKNAIIYTTQGEIEFLKGNQRAMMAAFRKAFDLGFVMRESWLTDEPYLSMLKIRKFRNLLEENKTQLKG